MLRHLQNINELIIYAAISCGAAFIGRLFPAFYYPIFLLRIGVLAYCALIIFGAEGRKHLALTLSGAMFLGLLGGYWDWIELYLRFNQELIGRYFVVLIVTVFTVGIFYGLPHFSKK